MEQRLKNLWLATLFFWALHIVEEMLTGFQNYDTGIVFLATHLGTSTTIVYLVIQAFGVAILILPFFLSFKILLLRIIFSLIFLFEWTHIFSAISGRGYYPGFWTAIPLVIIGLFFWKNSLLRFKETR